VKKHTIGKFTGLVAGAVIGMGAATSAIASLAFNGASGSLSASVQFDVSGGQLVVTLANTSPADVRVPTDVLTAVFFDHTPPLTLTRVSAVLASGSTVLFGGTDPGGVVGGEWAYKGGLSGTPAGAVLGISSTGLDLFGPRDLFPGSNLQGPASPDGLQYGLTSAGDNPTTGNAAVTGKYALIQSAVVFTFNVDPSITANDLHVDNVHFLYGTSLDDPTYDGVPVPEPTTMIAGGLLLVPFGVSTLRKTRTL
jgi:hypothetical protein